MNEPLKSRANDNAAHAARVVGVLAGRLFQQEDGMVECLGATVHDVHHGAGAVFVGFD